MHKKIVQSGWKILNRKQWAEIVITNIWNTIKVKTLKHFSQTLQSQVVTEIL